MLPGPSASEVSTLWRYTNLFIIIVIFVSIVWPGTEWWGAGMVICLERCADLFAYGPADATATHCLLLQLNPDWFYLSGTSSPG